MSTHSIIALLTPNAVHLLAVLAMLSLWSLQARATPMLRRARYLVIALTAWTWLVCTPAIGDLLLRSLENHPGNASPAPVQRNEESLVIVLASGELAYDDTEQPRLDVHGWERLYAGVRLWRQTGGQLVLTGGPADSDERAIAASMRTIAIDLGVPAPAIRLVDESHNTREDLLFAADAIRRSKGPVWLVTSAAHMPRALAVARALGLSLRPYPVDFRQIRIESAWAWLPDSRGPARFAMALRELIGRAVYRLRGWSD